jgi:hypothetical protein
MITIVVVHYWGHCVLIVRLMLRWRPLRRRWPLTRLWKSVCHAIRWRIAMMFHVWMRAVWSRRRRIRSWLRWGSWSTLRVGRIDRVGPVHRRRGGMA